MLSKCAKLFSEIMWETKKVIIILLVRHNLKGAY